MGRPELGTKCTCTGCSERFYDLNRQPAVCPKCGTQQQPEKPRATWSSRGATGPRRPFRPPVPVAEEDVAPITAVEDEEEEDDDAVIDAEDDDADAVLDADLDTTTD
jgi:uncharacterized protein (TIGR02300 family)